ncbi:MAG TPA: hypothetical protein VHZ24_14725 [Pirellulales bacterium]|jgi:hypothetical protein|nr:hypothetical protein [Pirellulales bacterium]
MRTIRLSLIAALVTAGSFAVASADPYNRSAQNKPLGQGNQAATRTMRSYSYAPQAVVTQQAAPAQRQPVVAQPQPAPQQPRVVQSTQPRTYRSYSYRPRTANDYTRNRNGLGFNGDNYGSRADDKALLRNSGFNW